MTAKLKTGENRMVTAQQYFYDLWLNFDARSYDDLTDDQGKFLCGLVFKEAKGWEQYEFAGEAASAEKSMEALSAYLLSFKLNPEEKEKLAADLVNEITKNAERFIRSKIDEMFEKEIEKMEMLEFWENPRHRKYDPEYINGTDYRR